MFYTLLFPIYVPNNIFFKYIEDWGFQASLSYFTRLYFSLETLISLSGYNLEREHISFKLISIDIDITQIITLLNYKKESIIKSINLNHIGIPLIKK